MMSKQHPTTKMSWRFALPNAFSTGLAIVGVVVLSAVTAVAQNITPEPIGLPPSAFPVPSSQLDAEAARGDTVALRIHAWTLWSGLTANSSQSFGGQVLPIWETWLSEQEAFSPTVRLLAAGTRPRVLLPFAPPKQFEHGAQDLAHALALGATPPSERLLAFVKMSPDSANFIAQSHETPANSGQSYTYLNQSDLAQLNAAFDQNHTPVKDRKIIDFPAAATDLKVVFLPVKAVGLSAIPVWAGAAASNRPSRPTPGTWTTCVAVDPTNSNSGTTAIDCNGTQVQAQIVPLNAFFSVRVDATEASTINAFSKLTGTAALAAGDYQVLVAMHITTKEIANWTWATFWWQNGLNPPNNFPGSVDGMPDASQVKGAWRNYAMCVGDSMVFPVADPKGKPVVCFNPYLETAQADGLDSNCMSCHAMARVPITATTPNVYPQTYLPNGWVDLGDPAIFGGETKTDFVWAIQNSAH
jgi:hypothetical protein